MTLDGWTSYAYKSAPHVLCQFWREGWDSTRIFNIADGGPEFNVAGLYWKMTGIGKEQFDLLNGKSQADWVKCAAKVKELER